MTHAYQEIYLSNAQALLGDAFDYAINACGIAGDSFIKLFSASSVSRRIENGEPAYLSGKAGSKRLSMFSLRPSAKRRPPNRKSISAAPESIGSAGQLPTTSGSLAGGSAIFSRFFRLMICGRCIPRSMKRTSASSLILPTPKCGSTLPTPISSASARCMAAHRRSLPNEAMSASGRFKCTNSATRTSTGPARKLSSALRKSSAVQWRIFWRSKSVTGGVYFPLKYHSN